MNKRRIVITGMGVITPLGLNIVDFWARLTAGKSGINSISRFDTSNFPVKVAAEIMEIGKDVVKKIKEMSKEIKA